jgi:hypothetical protein
MYVVDYGETWKVIKASTGDWVDGLYIEASNGKSAMVGCGNNQCPAAVDTWPTSYEQASQ